MSSLTVPKFQIKNKLDYSQPNPETEDDLNRESWRYLYDRTYDISNVPDPAGTSNSTTEQDHTKQLPWLTLYKTHKDLLQIRLVTTIGYVEDGSSSPSKYIPTFIKGFPLMIQGPHTQFNDKNNIPEKAWENNWPEYKKNVEDFSGNLMTSFNGNSWLNSNDGKVITDMSGNKNLIILDLNDNDFVLKNSDGEQVKFAGGLLPSNSNQNGIRRNYNGKSRPEYLVVRIDSAIEETSFAYYNGSTLLAPGVVRNNESGFNSSTNISGKLLKVFNYVYKGYVISPYDFMSRFTTDYLRGILSINNNEFAGYINKYLTDASSPDSIQVNSKFFSSTHDIRDGWDNSRKSVHEKIKTPFYYNFFLKPNLLAVKDISSNDAVSERFETIGYQAASLFADKGTNNTYYIEKLFWSSLTTPRHTVYSGNERSSVRKDKRNFIGNYLNVNEVDASYNTQTNTRVFLNSNADYMPSVTNVYNGARETMSMTGSFRFSINGSGTQANPWTGDSQSEGSSGSSYINFTANGPGTVYIYSTVSSESSHDWAYIIINGTQEWKASGTANFGTQQSHISYSLQTGGIVRFEYTKDTWTDIGADQQTYSIYFIGNEIPSISFQASGYIERDQIPGEEDSNGNITPAKYIGKNEINMARKSLTPYYYPDKNDEESYSKYAFLFPDTSGWQNNSNLIDTTTNNIEIDNCVVLEFRNLVEFNKDTRIIVDISLNKTSDSFNNSGKKTITFVESGNYTSNGQYSNSTHLLWKYNNNTVPLKNDVFHLTTTGDYRSVDNIDSEEFRIKWDSTNNAIAKKHIYVIDIATGSYDVPESAINISVEALNNGTIDPFLPATATINTNHKSLFAFKANVYQIKVNRSDNNGVIQRENGEFLNFSLDGVAQQLSIYNEPRIYADSTTTDPTTIARPLFGYFNFYGLTSSEFIGGVDWHKGGGINKQGQELLNNCNFWLKTVFKGVTQGARNRVLNNPYYLLSEGQDRFKQTYKDSTLIYFNSNIFYGATNFAFSNVFAKTTTTDVYNKTSILFIGKTDGPSAPEWRSSSYNTHGLEITSLSQNIKENGVTNKRFIVDKTGVELFNGTVFGKFNINNRTYDGITSNSNEPPCIELNDGLIAVDSGNTSNTLKLECLNFYKVAFVASQKNLFISDYWKWKERLVSLTIPNEAYTGIIPVGLDILDRTLNNRYNVYNWKALDVPSSLYSSGNSKVHNPQRAYENQSLINFSIEVSTISFNVSHILINTWAGNIDINNNLNQEAIVGLSSFANTSGSYDTIQGSPKLLIDGGLSVSPSIADNPVYLYIDIHGQLNFATDTTIGTIEDNEKSKAPSEIVEVEGTTPIDFGSNIFGLQNGGLGPPDGGWFTYNRPQTNQGSDKQLNRNGIFVPQADGAQTTPTERFYSTRDFSANALSIDPTKININTITYPGDGGFRKEEQKFPLELLFCYPFSLPDNIQKPNKLTTTYNNSDTVQTNVTFDNFKGYKRFSKLYALKIKGDNINDTNTNFRDRSIFPETILVNCVELPPPKQVNNFNDMLAEDNTFVKLVWKGYNFDYSVGNARSQLGNVGNIKWKIERFQTQLEIRKTIFEGIITPDGGDNANGFNLSTYTYIDKNIRIYDKYTYTVTGTFIYEFLRNSRDINIYTLEMPFGSFTTDELIVCKNNKFEYGRYNSTSTNLKLFRPLLINKDGGQVDHNGKPSAGGLCLGNIFSGSTRISSSQNIYANTTNQTTKKQTYVLLSKQQFRPFR